MLKDITFIIACLNNGYDDEENDPTPNYHRERTVRCVRHLIELYGANVVFVDWCSKEENKFLSFLPKKTKYIHVSEQVIDLLHENNQSNQLFYEWIAKDIGQHFATTKWLLFTNGDNFFSKELVSQLNSNLNPTKWYSATRVNIDNKIFQSSYDEFIKNVCLESDKTVPLARFENDNPVCTFCYGDFTLCTKTAYETAGGYVYTHKHAYEDHTLARTFALKGIEHVHINSKLLHIHHKKSGHSAIYSSQPIDKLKIKQFILETSQVINL